MTVNSLKKVKNPVVIVDDELGIFEGKVLFPKKLAKANKVLKTIGLPKVNKLV